MQPGVDAREDLGALLDESLRRANRCVRVRVLDLLLGRGDHALGRVCQPTQQVVQNARGRVKRQRHRKLADVVNARGSLNLEDLRRLNPIALTRDAPALELEHRLAVVDVRRVKKRTQRPGQRRGQPADKVGQPDRVRAAPGDKLVLDQPVELGELFVAALPVTVQRQNLARGVVDREDVRRAATLCHPIVVQPQEARDLVNTTNAVDVFLRGGLALDLVVGLLRRGQVVGLDVAGGKDTVNVAVYSLLHTLTEHVFRDVLDLGYARRAVEVGRRVRQQDVIDRHPLAARATLLRVPAPLEVLRAAKRDLREELLHLVAVLFNLLRELPVQELRLAVCNL